MNNTMLPVVILAGGLATRLRPLTANIPKALIPVNGEAFIHHQLRLLQKNKIKDVLLCVAYKGELIEETIGNGNEYGMHIQYAYDGDNLLGTAGAIKNAYHRLTESFFVLYGDSYLTCDYLAIQKAFQSGGKLGLMTIFNNAEKWDTSNVEYRNNRIICYDKEHHSDKMKFIDYGLGVFSKKVFACIPTGAPYDLALLYQDLLTADQLAAYEVKRRFYEVGSFSGIAELEYYLTQ